MRRRKAINLCVLCCGFLISFIGNAQDIHFSQFYYSPLFINPANTGVFMGDYRFSTNYKNQWQSITNPYKTIFAGFEISLPKKGIGVGASFFNDRAGKSKLGATQGNLSASYTVKVNKDNTFGAGMQFGFGQQSIKIADLKWDSQFINGSHDPATPSGETQLSQASTYMDLSAGMIWNYAPTIGTFKTSIGLAVFHANQPLKSFYGDEKLYYKIIAHSNSTIQTGNTRLFVLPQVLYVTQGPHSELILGSLIKYIISGTSNDLIASNTIDRKYFSSAVLAGAQMRYKDAFTLMSAFEFKKGLLVSISYDVNISKLYVASRFKGGMELALIYRGYF